MYNIPPVAQVAAKLTQLMPTFTPRHIASPSAFSLPDALIVPTIRRCAPRTPGATATVILHSLLSSAPRMEPSMLVNDQTPTKTRWRPGPVPPMLEEEAIGMGKNSGKSGGTGPRRTSMTPQAASRVQSAGAKNPDGRSAQSGSPARAQSAAAKGSRAAGK